MQPENGHKPTDVVTDAPGNRWSGADPNPPLNVRAEAIDASAIDPDRGERASRRNKKIVLLVVVMAVLGGAGIVGAYLLVKRANLDVLIGRRAAGDTAQSSGENLQRQAIEEVREVTGDPVPGRPLTCPL